MSESHIADSIRPPPPPREDVSDEKWAAQAEKIELASRLRALVNAAGRGYAECRFGNYVTADAYQASVLDAVKEWAATMPERLKAGENLILFGPVGTGKDHLAFSACRQAIIQHKRTVHWINGQDWFGDVRDAMGVDGEKESTTIGRLTHADVLVISDPLPPFGALTTHQATMLYRAIESRYADKLVTICTLNVKDDAEADTRLGVPTWDRLCDRAWKIHLNWETHRKPSREVKRK